MSQISPPIRILIVCAVAFLAAWMLFLRPSADAGAPAEEAPVPTASQPVDAGGEQAESLAGKAVEKANDAKAKADATSASIDAQSDAAGDGVVATTPGQPVAPATDPAQPAGAAAPAKAKTAEDAGGLPLRVLHAIADRKVVVLLFWQPKSADDRMVRKALSGIDRHHGRVVAQAAHINRIAAYQQITRGANVEQSPTIVVVDRDRKVQTLVGYVDRMTIDQAVTDALPKRQR